jgi:uncharacterized protein YggE
MDAQARQGGRMIALTRMHRFALGLALAQGLAACAHGGGHTHAQPARGTISVTGSGEARGTPDVVRTSIGVEARAAHAQEALTAANAQIAQVIKALKELGVADSDLRTHGFSISYDREYMAPAPAALSSVEPSVPTAARGKRQAGAEIASAPVEPQPTAPQPTRGSYVVNNQLEVTLRDVSKLGVLLSTATAAGANNIWGINFDLADKRPLIEKARAQAIENALADATRVAALAGVKLGKIVSVSDGVLGGPVPMGAMREKSVASNAVPVQEGELTVSHQVSVEVAIAE